MSPHGHYFILRANAEHTHVCRPPREKKKKPNLVTGWKGPPLGRFSFTRSLDIHMYVCTYYNTTEPSYNTGSPHAGGVTARVAAAAAALPLRTCIAAEFPLPLWASVLHIRNFICLKSTVYSKGKRKKERRRTTETHTHTHTRSKNNSPGRNSPPLHSSQRTAVSARRRQSTSCRRRRTRLRPRGYRNPPYR